MPIGRGQFQAALFPGIRKWWGTGYKAKPSVYRMVFDTKRSSQGYEDDQQKLGFGMLPTKSEHAPLYYATNQEGRFKRYEWTSFAMGFTVSRELIEDQKYAIITGMARELGVSAAHTAEQEAANILNLAFSTAQLGIDGLPLCHQAHTPGGSGTGSTQNNRPVDSTGAVSNVDLSDTALQIAETDISAITDDNGVPKNIMARKLVIAQRNRPLATQLLMSPQMPTTANRSINPFHKDYGPDLQLVVWPSYITDPDSWYMITDCPDGLQFFWRNPWELAQENDFDTKGKKYSIWGRFGVSWTDWRGVYGCPGQ